MLDGSSCLWAGASQGSWSFGKTRKNITRFYCEILPISGWTSIVWSMPSRDSQAHPQGKQGTTESQLILWNFMNFLTIFARISIFFCNGPVVKGRVRVWHVVWHLSLQDVLRVVGVGVSMVWSITWFHSWTSIPVGRMFSLTAMNQADAWRHADQISLGRCEEIQGEICEICQSLISVNQKQWYGNLYNSHKF